MFHSYVRAASGRIVDIGRAQFLMDKDLARETAEWIETSPGRVSAAPAEAGADAPSPRDQAFWERYCARHREKYGTPFVPDSDPDWS
ncbi:hypothetical protein SAMN06265365_12323 [Tistlia consotensis]|uniref:Uncharacterized protein n=1 Tax=Tistlia consotensis USBA 355 TaxID=560819 RepID=A0A1Y6CN99_9PROT|nr:hypothetical protein [Tistlia consotensis]SMF64720.1 hypothetical protein SAMN05428998_12586 [Tistlia consotensis USBA 355]SNR96854.1 hypothetical protein SAMN06265365_12323 [Tistlia consotensis]